MPWRNAFIKGLGLLMPKTAYFDIHTFVFWLGAKKFLKLSPKLVFGGGEDQNLICLVVPNKKKSAP